MSKPSMSEKALATLDEALRQADPINRMMLIEQALKLHRQSLEARDAALAAEVKRRTRPVRRPQR